MDRAKFIEYDLHKIDDDNFNLLQVRRDLEEQHLDEEEIKIIMRCVDNELQRRVKERLVFDQSRELIWFGAAISAVGVVLTVGTYTGAIDMGNSMLLAYGPILGGLSVLFAGVAKRTRR